MTSGFIRRSLVIAACGCVALFAGAWSVPPAVRASKPAAPPPIKHVFLILLENESFATTFGPASLAPYFADTLVKEGALLSEYYGVGHSSLDNYIAIISGLAPTPNSQGDCGLYLDFHETGMAPGGQPIGTGCVYPAHVPTIANQLAAKGLVWKAYMEDMGKEPSRESATCGHAVIGTSDRTEHATRTDQYAAKHNPFVYFHAIIDSASCQTNVIALPALATDLRSAGTTPSYSFIAPSLCHDGHDKPCRNGEPGGLVSADRFLQEWVPRIAGSPAYRDGGLIIITFDEAMSADKTACCNEPSGPNTTSPGAGGPGGGPIGAVLLSPYIKAGTVSDTPYNHYSMLKSVEEIFGLPFLGYAGERGLVAFGADVYTAAPKGR